MQKMLNRLDTGRNCHKEGLNAVKQAQTRKNNADARYRKATSQFNSAARAQVDFPKFIFSSLREGQCSQFWSSATYINAKRLYEKRRREKAAAKGAANDAA